MAIPKLTREEVVDAMLDAWEELDPNLGANAWEVVKLMPYELAQEKGWTPKEAFADIRHLDWPWQMVSNINLKMRAATLKLLSGIMSLNPTMTAL